MASYHNQKRLRPLNNGPVCWCKHKRSRHFCEQAFCEVDACGCAAFNARPAKKQAKTGESEPGLSLQDQLSAERFARAA